MLHRPYAVCGLVWFLTSALTVEPKLSSNSQFPCLNLPGTRITGMNHYIQIEHTVCTFSVYPNNFQVVIVNAMSLRTHK